MKSPLFEKQLDLTDKKVTEADGPEHPSSSSPRDPVAPLLQSAVASQHTKTDPRNLMNISYMQSKSQDNIIGRGGKVAEQSDGGPFNEPETSYFVQTQLNLNDGALDSLYAYGDDRILIPRDEMDQEGATGPHNISLKESSSKFQRLIDQ